MCKFNRWVTPTYYTEKEGGEWLPWRDEGFTVPLPNGGPTIWGRGLRLHSLKTKDGREWDCINGWRRDLPRKFEFSYQKAKAELEQTGKWFQATMAELEELSSNNADRRAQLKEELAVEIEKFALIEKKIMGKILRGEQ